MSLASGLLYAELDDVSNAPVASSNMTIGSSFSSDPARSPLTVSDVLHEEAPFSGGADYIAAPGSYTLKLFVFGSDGNCTGTGTFCYASMSYLLTGTNRSRGDASGAGRRGRRRVPFLDVE